MVFASAGHQVSIYDVFPSRVSSALKQIEEQLVNLEKSGSLRGNLMAKQQLALISGSSSLQNSVQDAFYIQECVPEVIEIKHKALSEIDAIMSENAIIGSSASALMPSKLSENLKHKNRFIIAHPANPPYFLPIVELVPAPWTDPEVTSKTRDLMTNVGQSPVTCKKEQNGFALCRMQYAIINECWRLVRDGYISVEDADVVMTEGLGRRYAFIGPMITAHLNAEGMANYFDRYRDSIYTTSQDLGSPPHLEGETAETITNELTRLVPLNKLDARRKWRDESLAELGKIRNKLDSN